MSTAFLTAYMPGWGEGLLVLVVILLFFGAKKLPELARALGRSSGEFQKGREEGGSDDEGGANAESEEKKSE